MEWFQVGSDITGEAAGDNFGGAVSLSSDGNHLAVGAKFNNAGGDKSGQVRIYEFDTSTSTWIQKGSDILGEAAGDQNGGSISLSSDGTRVAIGADRNDDGGANAGHVRVYEYVVGAESRGGDWIQMGSDIDGEASVDLSGRSVSLSNDGVRLAVGAHFNDGGGTSAGHVRVYEYSDVIDDWEQIGADIDGENTGDQSGISVSLSGDGVRVAIGAPNNAGNTGHVRVFAFTAETSTWNQVGLDIDGATSGDKTGLAVSLSEDGNRVAASSHLSDSAAVDAGSVRVFEYHTDSTSWVQLGSDILGEEEGDFSGWSLALSGNGERLVVGAIAHDGSGADSGHTKAFEFDSSLKDWVQLGSDIDGQSAGDSSGSSVAISRDGQRLVVGAPQNDANGIDAGSVRVFQVPFYPTSVPSSEPSSPSLSPLANPSGEPTMIPSVDPSVPPTKLPSLRPTSIPSRVPSSFPSTSPTSYPSIVPTSVPSKFLEWFQVGSDITGEAAGDNFGGAVSLSSDGNHLAVGAKFNNAGGDKSGQVRIYEFDTSTSTWIQKGSDILGEAAGDQNGGSISLSSDGTRVAIGADRNDDGGANAGHVRVYEYVVGAESRGGDWIQMGSDIDGEASVDLSGRSVSLSNDGVRLAVGAHFNDGGGTSAGHVRVYEYSDVIDDWEQIGADIDGENTGDQSGISVSLSGDGVRVAIGAPNNAGNTGHVRVFAFTAETSTWNQVGLDIDGATSGDKTGLAVSLSEDGNRVAASSHLSDSAAVDAGSVRVFEYHTDSTSWVQLGSDILGEEEGDFSGWSLALSGNGERLVVGAIAHDGSGADSGHTKAFEFDSSLKDWVQLGSDIDGQSAGDSSGSSVAISRDGQRLVVGAPQNDANGIDAGSVRVFQVPFYPTSVPSSEPTSPSNSPTTSAPSLGPTCPSSIPSTGPSCIPSSNPSVLPSARPTLHPSCRPTLKPSEMPSYFPTLNPSLLPSALPSNTPSGYPTPQPSAVPSHCPTFHPSDNPSGAPSFRPSGLPTSKPSVLPSVQPSSLPSQVPSGEPSSEPSAIPSSVPSSKPSSLPSMLPTLSPTSSPSFSPAANPSAHPTSQPSGCPTILPSGEPSGRPSAVPSVLPSSLPSQVPSGEPSSEPSTIPSSIPSSEPSSCPSMLPTLSPTSSPSYSPAANPSAHPTSQPSGYPTILPSGEPSGRPSAVPSVPPSSLPSQVPSGEPSSEPSAIPSGIPSSEPSSLPSMLPTLSPTELPSLSPAANPSAYPTSQPSGCPTILPSGEPSGGPSAAPSVLPSSTPSQVPSGEPSSEPSTIPSSIPSSEPSSCPSMLPTLSPTSSPSFSPAANPSAYPTSQPSGYPTILPSGEPSGRPSAVPSVPPSSLPSQVPSGEPSSEPSAIPSGVPSGEPSSLPSMLPTLSPTELPSLSPAASPSAYPTSQPSGYPTILPSGEPSGGPSAAPSVLPSSTPSQVPSGEPSSEPSTIPSSIPSSEPSSCPSAVPSSGPSFLPSQIPVGQPSVAPSSIPTTIPTFLPSTSPSRSPSTKPSVSPSYCPSNNPTSTPSYSPSACPSKYPSDSPSGSPTQYPFAVPSATPTVVPSDIPSAVPQAAPSFVPSQHPSGAPSNTPSMTPSAGPSMAPSCLPTLVPSSVPVSSPTYVPTFVPSGVPSFSPSGQPSAEPSAYPSRSPVADPSSQPTSIPAAFPSGSPTLVPSAAPSTGPSVIPSSDPTGYPSCEPSGKPSVVPSSTPSSVPTWAPSLVPSYVPSAEPTNRPSTSPTSLPSAQPTGIPSGQPTCVPSSFPTADPSTQPSGSPSATPSSLPTRSPVTSRPTKDGETNAPTHAPTPRPTAPPTGQPSSFPTSPSGEPSGQPSGQPSSQPSSPSGEPSNQPSVSPSTQPSASPSGEPTRQPSSEPSSQPTSVPSAQPSSQPTQPTGEPSTQPSSQPTAEPSTPSSQPSVIPSCNPTATPTVYPSCDPSAVPSIVPSSQPSRLPTVFPSGRPSSCPTYFPSALPSHLPSSHPTLVPSSCPSEAPTCAPSHPPSHSPSYLPSTIPSSGPSILPSAFPSTMPFSNPTLSPSTKPSADPSSVPTFAPSFSPSGTPSSSPTGHPSSFPTVLPTFAPSEMPSTVPTSAPSDLPSSRPSTTPTTLPSFEPSFKPTHLPSTLPSTCPSANPSHTPTLCPTSAPSHLPSFVPTGAPSNRPTGSPVCAPSPIPTQVPNATPSTIPTVVPSEVPQAAPSFVPSQLPSGAPSNTPSMTPSAGPSMAPSCLPTLVPSSVPVSSPTYVPTFVPSGVPSFSPSGQPSAEPSAYPSRSPVADPTSQPTSIPAAFPSGSPTLVPSAAPSTGPSVIPSSNPTAYPSCEPSGKPSAVPSSTPSSVPTWAPSPVPTCFPSAEPSSQPSINPTSLPSAQPTGIPSGQPTCVPSSSPSITPTFQPTSIPAAFPSGSPTLVPSAAPSNGPSVVPSSGPTGYPSCEPSGKPSVVPSSTPSSVPTWAPSLVPSCVPSAEPTNRPSTSPTSLPSAQPTGIPSGQPTCVPSSFPTADPSTQPSGSPSATPSSLPTRSPVTSRPTKDGETNAPTHAPTPRPTAPPTGQPSSFPTSPSGEPSGQPSGQPSSQPSSPSGEPSNQPSVSPSTQPSASPSGEPTRQPSSEPSSQPTSVPSAQPSSQPTQPTGEPSTQPSSQPTAEPSITPSSEPSSQPTGVPTGQPTEYPSGEPSGQPTSQPSVQPSQQPSGEPTLQPSSQPTGEPSGQPTDTPSGQPSCEPTGEPTGEPTCQPSGEPSGQPSTAPTSVPTSMPTLSYHTLFDSSTLEPPLGDLAFTYFINSAADYVHVNEAWVSFIDTYFRVPFELDYKVEQIWISGVSYGDIEPWVISNFSCSDISEITPIVDSLSSLEETNHSSICNNMTISAASSGDFCVNCGANDAGEYRCFDPKNGTFSLPGVESCYDWEWDGRITKHAVAIIFSSQEKVKFTVPSIADSHYSVLDNGIRVTAYTHSSSGGTIYCNAYKTDQYPDSSFISRSLLRTNGVAAPIQGSQDDAPLEVNITISELIAASEYAVYCHVEDSLGNQASFDDLVSTRSIVYTPCCRNIKYTKISKYLTASANLETVRFSFKFPSSPEQGLELTVKPYITHDSNGFSPLINVLPPSFTITRNNKKLGKVRSFALSSPLSVPDGQYWLHLNVSEKGDNSSFTNRYEGPAAIAVEVIGGSSPLPPPSLLSGIFSTSGNSVSVCFDGATDFGVNELGSSVNVEWVCNRIFSFNGDDVTSCTWISDTCAQLIFCGAGLCSKFGDRNSLMLLEPDDPIILKENVIKSACRPGTTCSLNLFADRATIIAEPPAFPLQPDIFIAASEAGGACDSPLTLDASSTTGNGGRPWKSILWSVSLAETDDGVIPTPTASEENEFAIIADYLNDYDSISAPITIPFNMLNSSNYRFSLSISNFLQIDPSDYSSASVDAEITSAASASTPFVYFDGSFYRSVRAFDEFSVIASSILPSCISSSTVSYSWRGYKEKIYAPSLQSLSTDSRRMKLDPYTLEAGVTYTFLVSATVDNGGFGFATLTVFVEFGSTYVSIAGASSLVIPFGNPLSLDASSSVLEDLSPADPNNVVQLSWSCVVTDIFSNLTDAVYGDSCDDILNVNVSDSTTIPSTENVPIITEILEAYVEYSVTASSVNALGEEVSATVTIQTLPPLVVLPTLTITSTFRKFNANKILQIFGTITTPVDAVAQNVTWLLYDDGENLLDLEPMLLTSNTKIVQPNNTFSFALSAKPFSFTPGRTYDFRLQALSTNNDKSFSQITLTANGPPTSGQFEVLPNSGVALQTGFFFNAAYWMEDASDYPITYIFRYTLQQISSDSVDVTFMNVGFSSQRSFKTSQLPAGLASLNRTVFTSVLISDFYGSATEAQTNVTVLENIAVATSAYTRRLATYNFSAAMDDAINIGDVDAVSIEVNNVIAALIAADCSTVPDCGLTYNRDVCYATAHSCGRCLEGYEGIEGDANSVCVPEGGNITFVNVSKVCPSVSTDSVCSGLGECLFYDTSTGGEIQNCTVEDAACIARCSCQDGQYGSACDFSYEDFEERLVTRDLMCKGLAYVGDNQDESNELMTSITSALQFAFNPYEVRSIESLETCLHVVRILVNMSNHGYLPNEPFFTDDGTTSPQQSILHFSSNLVEFFLIESNHIANVTNTSVEIVLTDLMNLINALVSSISSNMVGGEADLEIISNGFSVSVKFSSLEDLLNATLTPPITSSDIKYGRDVPSIILPASGLKACEVFSDGESGDNEYVRLSLSNWHKNPYVVASESALAANDTLSTSVLRFSSVSSSATSSEANKNAATTEFDTNYTLILQWNTEQDWNNTNDFPSIASFNEDGSLGDAPCEIVEVSSTSATFTCFNLLDLCPQQYESSNTTNRRLEMESGVNGVGFYPAIYPDHPHYAYWSSVKLKEHVSRRLDFDYGGEGDDDMSGSVSILDYGALITSAAAEVRTTIKADPRVAVTPQGISVLIGLTVCFFLFIAALVYFIKWDASDRKLEYAIPSGKATALVNMNELNHWSEYDVDDEDMSESDEKADDSQPQRQLIHTMSSVRRGIVRETKEKQIGITSVVNNFLESTVPPVFMDSHKSGWARFMLAVCRQHNWVRCVTFRSRRFPRWIRFMVVLTDILLLMFVDSLFFGLMFVDDGYCESLSGEDNQELCEERPSKMQNDISMCHFDVETFECTLRPPPPDITFFLMVAMIVTICSILPSVFCENILEHICSKTPRFANRFIADSKYKMNAYEMRKNTKALMSSVEKEENNKIHRKSSFLSSLKQATDEALSKKPASMHDISAYMDTCTLQEEVNILTTSARKAIHYHLATRAMPWEVRSLNADDGAARSTALKNIIGLNEDGSPVPLTAFQSLYFGSARKKLEWKSKQVRKKVESMLEDIDVFLRADRGCVDHINAYLIQSFIIEQLSPMRRYSVLEEFFQFDDANPALIDSFPWLVSWTFLILLWLFLVYWCLMWGLQNSRLTAQSWALQMAFVLVQECFVNESMQVLIKNVIIVETVRAQVRRTIDVLNSILVTKLESMGPSRCNVRDNEGFNVAQHMSASCRVSRRPLFRNLVASKVLMLINDKDIALCREARLTRLGFFTKMVITLPALLAMSHESVQECFLDVVIPTMWCCFVLANSMLYVISPALLVAPYLVLLFLIIHRYYYLLPKRRRKRHHDQVQIDQHKIRNDSKSSGYEEHQDSVDNMWRNMNLSISLKDVDGHFPTVQEHSIFYGDEEILNFPDEIRKQKVQSRNVEEFYKQEERASGFNKFVNDFIWVPQQQPIPRQKYFEEDMPEVDDSDLWESDDIRDVMIDKLNDNWNDVFNSFGKRSMRMRSQSSLRDTRASSMSSLRQPSTNRELIKWQSTTSILSQPPHLQAPARRPLSKSRSTAQIMSIQSKAFPSTRSLTKQVSVPSLGKPIQRPSSLSRLRSSSTLGGLGVKHTSSANVDGRLMALSTMYKSKKYLMELEDAEGDEFSPHKDATATFTKVQFDGDVSSSDDDDKKLGVSSNHEIVKHDTQEPGYGRDLWNDYEEEQEQTDTTDVNANDETLWGRL